MGGERYLQPLVVEQLEVLCYELWGVGDELETGQS
jgi:hypothetical protein